MFLSDGETVQAILTGIFANALWSAVSRGGAKVLGAAHDVIAAPPPTEVHAIRDAVTKLIEDLDLTR